VEAIREIISGLGGYTRLFKGKYFLLLFAPVASGGQDWQQ
jgi:hypothetical protein